MRRLISKLDTGLGNRLQQIFSASYIAQRVGMQYMAQWHLNNNCTATWADLFHEPLNIVSDCQYRQSIYGKTLELDNGSRITNQEKKLMQEYDTVVFKIPDLVMLKDDNKALVWSEMRRKFHKFKLNPRIMDSIVGFGMTCPIEKSIGVHVRRGDAPNFRKTPKESYFTELDQTDDPIFLSSDCPEVKADFKKRYGDRLNTRAIFNFSWTSPELVKDGLIDLILLSKTKRIICGESSFNRFASIVGNTPRKVIK